MHDYLSACFHDFVKNPQIGGTLKNFIPDCGIKSVGAAIEFKFVRDKDEVAKAFSILKLSRPRRLRQANSRCGTRRRTGLSGAKLLRT
jgi:hypothetical protein